ncbi:hypothetical protein PHLGIDRAFT_333860 [Phlebiopsis gigantea 11061_1 CR5-6]|uniref:RING-type domain-containing protein n=1 Tax=Phlebiopsis gigantea (strain 11061_1 CR5-6) TaxID=745531 RepID=A0A0C3SD41_PHLG1|nr:hypothetical protein PHLGIDRAFT_333860 [Phlebiopsis gigantea 11061_1 CR5-6]
MLIVHPTSTCDVCLEPYSWTNTSSTPHAIACGHVFCLQCLLSTHPSNCPLCRKAYIPERVKKLHVDPHSETMEDDVLFQINRRLRRLALTSGENTPEGEAMDVIREVNGWLASRGQGDSVYRPLRYAVAALHRYIAVQREASTTREAIEKQEQEFSKYMRLRDLDLQTARTIEENLLDRLQRTEEEYEEKLVRAERSRAEMEVEFVRMRAEHAQFRDELAKYRSQYVPQVSSARSAYHDRPVTSMSRYSVPSNPVIPGYPGSARNPASHIYSEPLRPIDAFPAIVEDDEPAPRSKDSSRPPVVIPGASAAKKVIPPPPAPPRTRNSDYIVSPSVYVIPDPRQPTHATGNGVPMSIYDQDTPRAAVPNAVIPPRPQTPPYGFVPGVGYVPRASSPPQHIPAHAAPAEPAVGQLMLYSQSSEPIDITTGRTVEAAARAFAISSGEVETRDSTWGHIGNSITTRSNVSTSSLATTVATTNRVPLTSSTTSASASFRSLAILAAPAGPARSPSPAASRPERRRVASPEPSLASTWGTVPSARSSRSSGIGDLQLTSLPAALAEMDFASRNVSHSSSMADLRLGRLPDASASAASLVNDNDSDSEDVGSGTPRVSSGRSISLWPGATPTSASAIQGPQGADGTHASASRARFPDGSGDSSSRAAVPVLPPAGLGLALSGPNSSQQQVSGQEDLHHVNHSLMQLVTETRNSRRRSRRLSSSDVESSAGFRSQSREARLQRVGPAQVADEMGVVRRADPAPSANGSLPGIHTDRVPGPRMRHDPPQESRDASDADVRRRRRHSTMTAAPQMASSVSFHSERDVPHTAVAPELSPRSRSQSQHFGSFDSTGGPPPVLGGSSLLLSFAPPGPTTSAATTSTGEPSSIRAPRPINGGHTRNIFALWNSRHAH